MPVMPDHWIRNMARSYDMIAPFEEKMQRKGVISYGLSSYGYDLRVSDEFKIFTNVNSAIVDPKNFDERSFVSVQASSVLGGKVSDLRSICVNQRHIFCLSPRYNKSKPRANL